MEASGFLFLSFFLSSFLLPFSSSKSAVTPKSLPFMDTPALLESSFFIEVFHTGSFQSFGSVSAPWGQSINLIPLQHDSLSAAEDLNCDASVSCSHSALHKYLSQRGLPENIPRRIGFPVPLSSWLSSCPNFRTETGLQR